MIYFIGPDLTRPSGGVRTIYRSVDVLNAAGLPAAVLHSRTDFRCSWLENATPVVSPPPRIARAEGFGLPPAEAIACGYHVIGFPQDGWREIFRPPFAVAIGDGDVLALATAVEAFLEGYDHRASELEQRAVEGSMFIASTDSRECATEDLARVIRILGALHRPQRSKPSSIAAISRRGVAARAT